MSAVSSNFRGAVFMRAIVEPSARPVKRRALRYRFLERVRDEARRSVAIMIGCVRHRRGLAEGQTGAQVMGSAARVTSAAEGLPRRRFTVAEVEAMVAAGVMEEDERVELIGGELVPMSPKGNHHEVMKVALLARWYRARPDEVLLTPETTFRLSEDTYLEPDVPVYSSSLQPKDLRGSNVLLIV